MQKPLLHTTKTLSSSHSPASAWHSDQHSVTKQLVFVQCFPLVFWPSTSSDNLHLFSLCLSGALEPNYPSRTQRSYHSGHASLFTMLSTEVLQDSQHTCHCIDGADETLASPPLFWCQVQNHVQHLDSRSIYLMGVLVIVSHVFSTEARQYMLFVKSHSKVGTCYLFNCV